MKTIGPRRPALSRRSAIVLCTVMRSPGRIGSRYSQSEPPSSPRKDSPMSSLTSGIAAESDRPKVGGALIPPQRGMVPACPFLRAYLDDGAFFRLPPIRLRDDHVVRRGLFAGQSRHLG